MVATTSATATTAPDIAVHEFFSSIQGEGWLTGTPMTFIRLWGCNLTCPWCDTPQASKDQHTTTIKALTAAAYALGNKWVCITGGEPTIHLGFDALVESLQAANLRVAVETNGTRSWTSVPDWVCVSPKVKGSMLKNVPLFTDEVKLLVGAGPDHYDAEEFIVNYPDLCSVTCLQPVWHGEGGYKHSGCSISWTNTLRAIELCHKYQVRLSVQMHRLIGVK